VRRLTLYGRPGCHLCEEVDISLDPRLERRLGERIPVVEIDGEEVLELRFGPAELVRALDKVRA
jgi:hypothetical protein